MEGSIPRSSYEAPSGDDCKMGIVMQSSFNSQGSCVMSDHNELPRGFNFTNVIDNHTPLHASYMAPYPQANSVEMHALPQQAYVANGVPDRLIAPHATGGVMTPRFHQPSDLYDRQQRDYYAKPMSPAGNIENHIEFRTLVTSHPVSQAQTIGDVNKNLSSEHCVKPYDISDSDRKRPERRKVPDNMKDGRYLERRQKNNLAAKKSRDQRKQREIDQQKRASELERENTVLRAQKEALCNEAKALKDMIFAKKGHHL